MAKKEFVVVTTKHKGVFFGELKKHDQEKETCILKDAQMCVYWSTVERGVFGLAKTGPSDGCRITPIIPEIYLNGITAVMKCTAIAAKNWRKQPWI